MDLTHLKSASKWPCPVKTYLLKRRFSCALLFLASSAQKSFNFPVWSRIAIPPLTSLRLYLINYSLHEVKLPFQRWIQKQRQGIEFHSHSMPNSLGASFTQIRPLPLRKDNTGYRHFFARKNRNIKLHIWEWQRKWRIKAVFNMKFGIFSTSSLSHEYIVGYAHYARSLPLCLNKVTNQLKYKSHLDQTHQQNKLPNPSRSGKKKKKSLFLFRPLQH